MGPRKVYVIALKHKLNGKGILRVFTLSIDIDNWKPAITFSSTEILTCTVASATLSAFFTVMASQAAFTAIFTRTPLNIRVTI